MLEPLTDFKLITACAAFPPAADLADADTPVRHMLGSVARRWLALNDEIKVHSRHLKARTKKVAPRPIAAFGIGPDIAAELLVAADDNTDRIRSEAAFAKLGGSCPIPRHRARPIAIA